MRTEKQFLKQVEVIMCNQGIRLKQNEKLEQSNKPRKKWKGDQLVSFLIEFDYKDNKTTGEEKEMFS